MIIENIFEKDINRSIDGVIKANDLTHIDDEVDEYVITNEIEDKLETFFDAYASSLSKPSKDIGVWISGFFGSGKSHLLKILSVVMGNQDKYKDIFLDKLASCDTFLQANAKQALSVPTQTILFNIDQQANVMHGDTSSSVLSVFQRVFDDMRGYYGEKAYIAELEKFLDEEGLYESFKSAYLDVAGDTWENKRHQVLIKRKEFAKALSQTLDISEEEAKTKLKEFQEDYSLDPHKFTDEVKQYIAKQESNFRLIFLVDEIGQFIADDVNKMLNLQTIVESLSEKCGSQAWVFVTSQQDIESIMGDINAQQQHDFARIMGRFKTKLNLTSANADEVIKKRILSKTEDASVELRRHYYEQQASLKSLFYFTDGMQYQQIQTEEDFESNYPFIPYQFDLLGMSLLELSRHNAMLGRAQSVGERSMLELFQNTAKMVKNKEVGILSDFSNFYRPLQTILKTEVINAIKLAETNPVLDDFDRKVLKTLFLVRYIESFKPNKANIAILLISKLDEDKLALEKRVQESLNKLENQTFIQRNGELYFYLTNEEKDIIEEIKNIAIDNYAINDHLSSVIYDGTMGATNKITHPDYKQDYHFTRRLDDEVKSSREYEIGINIITPYYHLQSEAELISKSQGSHDLLVKLPDDDVLKKEIRLFLQTQKYYKQYASDTSRSESYKRILNEQVQDNNNRKINITKRIDKLLQGAEFLANGRVLDLKGLDPKTKIVNAFNESILEFYPQRRILREHYKESDITAILNAADDLTTGSKDNLTEAEQAIVNKISFAKQKNDILTLKTLIEDYGTFPYGWGRWAVICLVASLWRKGRADIKLHGDILGIKELGENLTNTHNYPNLVVIQAYTPPTSAIRIVKEIYNEIFSQPLSASEAKDVYTQFKAAMSELVETMKSIYAKQADYPFVSVLKEPIELYEKVSNLMQSDLFEKIGSYQDDLEDSYEDHISKIKQFMNSGGKVSVYDAIKHFYMREAANLQYITNKSDIEQLNAFIHDTKPYRSGLAQKANEAFMRVKAELEEMLNSERARVVKEADKYIDLFQNDEDFNRYLEPAQKNQVQKPFLDVKSSVDNIYIIDSLKQTISNLHDTYVEQSDMADEMIYLAKVERGEIIEEKPKPTVKISSLQGRFRGRYLENENDVEAYLNELKVELLKTIQEEKKISL
jgi:hypothetical protein